MYESSYRARMVGGNAEKARSRSPNPGTGQSEIVLESAYGFSLELLKSDQKQGDIEQQQHDENGSKR